MTSRGRINITIRLQKALAQAGVASRRKSEELILAGRIAVNGKIADELGVKVSAADKITLDGKPLKQEKKVYIMLHKPESVITTAHDPQGRPTVFDYVSAGVRLFAVGRLDFETSGLLFLSNDGEWANRLMHPSSKVKKTYIAVLHGNVTQEKLQKFRRGIKIEGQMTAPAEICILRERNQSTTVKITIREGRNRQVRKMCDAIGCPVTKLKRVAIGNVELGDLPVGEWRRLKKEETIVV